MGRRHNEEEPTNWAEIVFGPRGWVTALVLAGLYLLIQGKMEAASTCGSAAVVIWFLWG